MSIDTDERRRRWVDATVAGTLSDMQTAMSGGEGGRNVALNDAAFRLGQLVGALDITRDDAGAALRGAVEGYGLAEAGMRATIRSGLNAGEKTPKGWAQGPGRDLPPDGAPSGWVPPAAPAERPPPPPIDRHDPGEVVALWHAGAGFACDDGACRWLAARRGKVEQHTGGPLPSDCLDPEAVDAFDLARWLPDGAWCPSWAGGAGWRWADGWSVLLPCYSAAGELVAMRARWGRTEDVDGRTVEAPLQERPKEPTPLHGGCRAAVYADPVGRALLRAGPTLAPGDELETSAGPVIWDGRVYVIEGGPGWLLYSTAPDRVTSDPQGARVSAVLGVWSGAWPADGVPEADNIGGRFHPDATFILATDANRAGDRYADNITTSLRAHGVRDVRRFRAEGGGKGGGPDDAGICTLADLFNGAEHMAEIHDAGPSPGPADGDVWGRDDGPAPGGDGKPKHTDGFDPDKVSARVQTLGAWGWSLSEAPPAREYLLSAPPKDYEHGGARWVGMLPQGKVGMLAAAGAAGKTMALVQLAVAVASGNPMAAGAGGADAPLWLGTYRVDRPGRVFLALGEEDAQEAHRRVWHACELLQLTPRQRERLATQLVIAPMTGLNVALQRRPPSTTGGPPLPTAFADWLRTHLVEHGPWSLVILDPLSRFAGMDAETDNAAATRFVEVLEAMTEDTENNGTPTVLVAHHTTKAARKDGQNDATAARGASALTDGVRWVANLSTKDDGVVAFEVSKSNYAMHPATLFLVRDRAHGGAPRPETPAERTAREAAAEAKQKAKGAAKPKDTPPAKRLSHGIPV